jgi:hypothetical protein
MEGNLFISLNTERTNSESSFWGNGSLSSQIF